MSVGRITGKIVRYGWLTMTTAVAAITVLSAHGGRFNPEWSTWPALLSMAFPAFICATIILGVINIFISRRMAIVQGVAIVLSAGAIWDICPLNLLRPSINESNADKVFTLFDYNTFQLDDKRGKYPDGTNRSLSVIIAADADIACIQETGTIRLNPYRHITKAQIDSVKERYPYHVTSDDTGSSIISKYPLKLIKLAQPDFTPYGSWTAAETEIEGDTILIVSVHLESIGLGKEDKDVYRKLLDGSAEGEWRSGSRKLIGKLRQAFVHRAVQARMLREQLDSLNYRNVIVAGDFNDIENCYAMRTISGGRMKSAFAKVGIGPMITYNSDHFLFNIDHVMYCGKLKAARLTRGNSLSSDHYPLTVTFIRE